MDSPRFGGGFLCVTRDRLSWHVAAMNNATELFFEHQKSVSAFAYFQLGLTASAIAFAVHQTKDATIAQTPWPIGVAVTLWAVSFFCGGLGLEARNKAIMLNARFLILQAQLPAGYQQSPEWQTTVARMEADVEQVMQSPPVRFRWQMRLMYLGAIAYVAGHVMKMAAAG